MKKKISLFIIACASCYLAAAQQTSSTPQDSIGAYSHYRIGGYGEMAASYMNYGQNRFTPSGSSSDQGKVISILCFVLAFDYKFSPNVFTPGCCPGWLIEMECIAIKRGGCS